MDRIVAQLDHEEFFLYAAPAYGEGMPGGAREEFPPTTELPEHHRWRWNGEKYETAPDYRGTLLYRPDGTTYYPESWGPLPDGDSITPPPPPPPTLEEALAAKLAEIMRGYSAAFAPIETVYPAAEREGWPIQEAEAKALLVDPQAETPVLSALVQLRARGETAADLAAKVLQNAGQWRMVYAYLTGQQQRMYGEVVTLAGQEGISGEDIAAYPVEYRMPEGM